MGLYSRVVFPRLFELSAKGRGLEAPTGVLQGVPLEQDHHLLWVFGVSEDARPEAPRVLASLDVCAEDLPPTSVISDLVPLEQVWHGRSPPYRPAPVRINLEHHGQDASPPTPESLQPETSAQYLGTNSSTEE